MKKVTFDYSLKNIPVPNKDSYLKCMIDKTQQFFQRIRWKVFFEENKDKKHIVKETYGFKTEKSAPPHKELAKFESDIINLIHNLEYKTNKNQFQNKLSKDVKEIQKCKNILLSADKTNNLYEVEKDVYKKLLRDNVTSEYELAPPDLEDKINQNAKKLANQIDLGERIEVMAHKNAYVTVKDHKQNFENNTKCRLINPAKSNIGRISKIELQRINAEIRLKTQLLQWRNTDEVLKWFKKVKDKNSLEFIQFDIVNFYPSIDEKLFDNAIEFAQKFVKIPPKTINIIKNARESLLFSDGKVWKKKTGVFDVTMGAYDGAEVCELVGLLILEKLKNNFPEITSGLYRDDGLGVTEATSKCTMERKKKAIIKMFKEMGLEITIDSNMKTVNFLDTTMSIKDGKFWPYSKPNNNIKYVHTNSNHPTHVIKQIPIGINKRLNRISCDEQHFNKAKNEYEDALKKSGHNFELKFDKSVKERKHKKYRSKSTIWYNPPFNSQIKTAFGKEFLKILDYNFPEKHPFNKFLNRHTIKISYSCTKNMSAIIANHNMKLLQEEATTKNERDCNCRNKEKCPLNGKCLTQTVIYKAELHDHKTKRNYIGCTEGEFKTRYNNHTASFRHKNKKSNTTLSSLVWQTGQNPTPEVKWQIMKKCHKYKPGNKTCDLCISEKICILRADKDNINKRNEIGSLCPHRNNFKLDRLKLANPVQI